MESRFTFSKAAHATLWVGLGIGAGMLALYGVSYVSDKVKALSSGGSK
jgi:hypothetical protein